MRGSRGPSTRNAWPLSRRSIRDCETGDAMKPTIGMKLASMLVCAVALGSGAAAQVVVQPAPAQPQQQRPDEILVRTYNVSDLLRLTADYPMDSNIGAPSELGNGVNRAWHSGVVTGGGGGGQSLFGG